MCLQFHWTAIGKLDFVGILSITTEVIACDWVAAFLKHITEAGQVAGMVFVGYSWFRFVHIKTLPLHISYSKGKLS